MKILDLVESARSANETAFEGIPDKRAARIVSAVLKDTAQRIDKADEGRISIAGFGSFVIKEADRDQARRRVIFRPARASEKS